MKELISDHICLKFFDPKLKTKVTCDASKFGLGATLEQKYDDQWFPIAFKSRSCTQAEQNYSTIEKETLAIMFACSNFHEYIYGQQFVVESDHKSLNEPNPETDY